MEFIKCVRGWHLDNSLIFEYGREYPIIDEYIDGDKGVQSYQILNTRNNIAIWFHSGSDYFNIDFIK